MRVLLDTNIVLDYLGANQGFTEDAGKVFDLAAKRKDIKLENRALEIRRVGNAASDCC